LTAPRRRSRAASPFARCLFLAAVLASVAGCATLKPSAEPEVFPDERRPIDDLLRYLAQRGAAFKSLRALAGVRYEGPDGRHSFQEVVLIERPDKLRLETLSPLGALLILTAADGELASLAQQAGVFYRGKSSPENLYRYTQIPLGVRELTAVLMGLPPANVDGGEWKVEGPAVARARAGWKEAITFDAARPLPVRWQLFNPEGKIEMSARFSDFADTPAGPFPLKIFLEAPAQKRRLEIVYKEPEVNVELASALFVQQKPENAREVPLDSAGG